jgi:hypothetical protein
MFFVGLRFAAAALVVGLFSWRNLRRYDPVRA